MLITSKFPSYCHTCGGRIAVGDTIDWVRGRVRHPKCVDAATAAVANHRTASLTASRATAVEHTYPAPAGLDYFPFQRAGIAYALGRPTTLIADEMGLGKTVQAIGVINADQNVQKVLVVCPAGLRLNWRRELERWLVRQLSVEIAGQAWPNSDIVIANYDVLHKFEDELRSTAWDFLVLDEVHYLKNPKSRRSRMILGDRNLPPVKAARTVALTGTPLPNRPIELWTIAHFLDPKEYSSFMGFAKRYCAAVKTRWGWDFSGASNLEELQQRLRSTIMIRRLKSEVLTELPPKRRQIIEIPANGAAGAVAAENAAWQQYEDQLDRLRAVTALAAADENPQAYDDAVAQLREGVGIAFGAISRERHATAVAKIPAVIQHMQDVLDTEGKLVIFAHHHDVVDALAECLGDQAVVVTGRDTAIKRQAAVDRFQSDPTCRVFIGSITAAGVGITLTAASRVLFAELDWVPANVTQAEDRVHRIGQNDSVLIQHLVLEGSLDARMAHILVEKQAIADAALDAAPIALTTRSREPAPTPSELETVGASLTATQIEAIHAGLRLLAGCDADRASALNDIGFNKLDSRIGHRLAEAFRLTPKQAALGQKILLKYHRQLGVTMTDIIRGNAVPSNASPT